MVNMTDYAPKKAASDEAVNAGTSGLSAWDHKPGDPERPDWRDLMTGADVRLMDVNQPSSYERLAGGEKAAIQGWLAQELRPGPLAGPHASYGLKHIYERLTRHYLTNGQLKGAMLAAGFVPVDRCELNWWFRYVADPKLRPRSIEADIARRRVA
jgi:hypothetical protein